MTINIHTPESGVLLARRKGDVYVVLVDEDIAKRYANVSLNVNAKGYVVFSKAYDGHHMLHTAILGAKEGFVIDHVNNDKLDNRRANLQHVTNAENCRKRPVHKKPKSGFRGVVEVSNGYQASITYLGERKDLGIHRTKEDAAIAYDRAARFYHGNFACLNFPNEGEIKAEAS